MSYASSHNVQPPAALLQDRSWRLRHSAWLLAPILGFGAFGFVGFVYIATRTRSRRLWKFAAIYSTVSGLLMISLTMVSSGSTMSGINGLLLIALWLGGTIHAVILNREYLSWRATSRPWYAGAATTPHEPQPQPATQPLQRLGMDTQQYFAPVASPSPAPTYRPVVQPGPMPSADVASPAQLVDVNLADEAALANVPGLNDQWARHIVAVRSNRRGFASLTDFTQAVGIQPHHLIRVQNYLTFSPIQTLETQSQSRPTRGRIVDI